MMDTVDQVVHDLEERKRIGIERYGKALSADMPHNMLQEAYEEALDLCIYLRCAIEKRSVDNSIDEQ